MRAWFAKRIVIVGAESTGTTTLAMDLATALGTCWISEYGRDYSLAKQEAGETAWDTSEFSIIAAEQNRMEDEAARRCNRILICDTDSFATTLWHRRYMGFDSDEVLEIANTRKADLYLLTGDEIPFVQDGLRDSEHIRHDMHRWFEDALKEQPVPWHLIEGSREERLANALSIVRSLW